MRNFTSAYMQGWTSERTYSRTSGRFCPIVFTHVAPLRAERSAMTKPRYSKHILLVPWSFVLIYRCSTGTVEMYLIMLSPLDLLPKSTLWSHMYLSGFRISHESSFNIWKKKKNQTILNYPNLNSALTETTQACFPSCCEKYSFSSFGMLLLFCQASFL